VKSFIYEEETIIWSGPNFAQSYAKFWRWSGFKCGMDQSLCSLTCVIIFRTLSYYHHHRAKRLLCSLSTHGHTSQMNAWQDSHTCLVANCPTAVANHITKIIPLNRQKVLLLQTKPSTC